MLFQRIMFHVNHVLAIGLLVPLVITMLRKNLHRQTPVFFCYVASDTFGIFAIYMFALLLPPGWYWIGAWIQNEVAIVLAFATIVEVFSKLFSSYAGIRRLARNVMLWAAVLLALVALITLVFFHEMVYTTSVLTALTMIDRCLRVIQLGLILVLFALSRYLHLRWKNFVFGIALGFGFYALMSLATSVIRAHYGQMLAGTMNVVGDGSYCLSVLIWLVYALQPEVATIPVVSLPSHELEKWDLALSRLLGYPTSSSIPAAGK